MPSQYHRSRPEGLAHRAKLQAMVLPKLQPGSRIPSSRFLGYMLGISGTEGYRHMRRLLEETGVATETRGIGKARRVYVVSLERGA
jgi:hypothetical protein